MIWKAFVLLVNVVFNKSLFIIDTSWFVLLSVIYLIIGDYFFIDILFINFTLKKSFINDVVHFFVNNDIRAKERKRWKEKHIRKCSTTIALGYSFVQVGISLFNDEYDV